MGTPSSAHKIINTLKSAGIDGFLLALIGVVVLAYFWPVPGAYEGTVSLSKIANWGISFIFFFYGLRLSPKKLKEGLSNWKLHLVVQSTCFIIFPLLALLIMWIAGGNNQNPLWLGFFFLAVLPSTVSSSVVMASIAKGNLPGAIFNASISSLLGVFITPLWMSIFLTVGPGQLALGPVILSLVVQVIVPVTAGVLLNAKFGWIAEKYKKTLSIFDQTVILLIIYTSFCESFEHNIFSGFKIQYIVLLGAAMVALFFTVYGIVYLISNGLRFNREDHITAQFCGSKKSLVHGTVMSKVLFPNSNYVGIILLPLMLYHALQLVVVSIIARRFAKQVPNKTS